MVAMHYTFYYVVVIYSSVFQFQANQLLLIIRFEVHHNQLHFQFTKVLKSDTLILGKAILLSDF